MCEVWKNKIKYKPISERVLLFRGLCSSFLLWTSTSCSTFLPPTPHCCWSFTLIQGWLASSGLCNLFITKKAGVWQWKLQEWKKRGLKETKQLNLIQNNLWFCHCPFCSPTKSKYHMQQYSPPALISLQSYLMVVKDSNAYLVFWFTVS